MSIEDVVESDKPKRTDEFGFDVWGAHWRGVPQIRDCPGSYDSGQASGSGYFASLLCLGERRDPRILERYPCVPQITWAEVLRFIHSRFRNCRSKQVSHEQWDGTGHKLWKAVEESGDDAKAFVNQIEAVRPERASAQQKA